MIIKNLTPENRAALNAVREVASYVALHLREAAVAEAIRLQLELDVARGKYGEVE